MPDAKWRRSPKPKIPSLPADPTTTRVPEPRWPVHNWSRAPWIGWLDPKSVSCNDSASMTCTGTWNGLFPMCDHKPRCSSHNSTATERIQALSPLWPNKPSSMGTSYSKVHVPFVPFVPFVPSDCTSSCLSFVSAVRHSMLLPNGPITRARHRPQSWTLKLIPKRSLAWISNVFVRPAAATRNPPKWFCSFTTHLLGTANDAVTAGSNVFFPPDARIKPPP